MPKSDFDGEHSIVLFVNQPLLMIAWIFAIPVITAFICWIFNKALIYFLVGGSDTEKSVDRQTAFMQKKQTQITEALPVLVTTKFITSQNMQSLLNNGDHFAKIRPFIEEHMDDFLRNRLKIVFPVIGMFIGDKTISDLKGHFMTELEQLFPQVISKYAEHVFTPVQVQAQIRSVLEKVNITGILKRYLSRELRFLSTWSAFSGFISGLVVLLLLLLLD